jgi:hypothetical protein
LDKLAWDPEGFLWKDPSSNGKLSQFFEHLEKKEHATWDVHNVPNEFRECFLKELWCRKTNEKN